MTATITIGERIEHVRAKIAEAAISAGRSPDEITLVAVTKSADRAAIEDAYTLGIRHFGENRVQDAARRYESPLPGDADLHMIGQLQTNKVRPALGLFSVIESVDRPSLVRALSKEAERRHQPVPVLIQVNIAGDAQNPPGFASAG
jgi:uncharacterized pyridoxal phosphate-containing UPF0001 family protein